MQPEVFVTGAQGNVGAEVVKYLSAADSLNVRTGVRTLPTSNPRQHFSGSIEPVLFDFKRPETFAPALRGIRTVFLMRPPQISNVQKYIFPFIDEARSAGVQQVVFLSLIGIENNTIVPHYKIEQYLRASGMAFTFLRASFFMQNLNTTHRDEICERDEIYVPVGKGRTSFIDVRDIGAIAALTLAQPGHENQAYDLTGPEALDYYQVAALFSQVLGRTITYKNPSALAFFFHQLRKNPSVPYAVVTTWLYTNTRSGMAAQVTGEVQRLLGRSPVSLLRYIEDFRYCWVKNT